MHALHFKYFHESENPQLICSLGQSTVTNAALLICIGLHEYLGNLNSCKAVQSKRLRVGSWL